MKINSYKTLLIKHFLKSLRSNKTLWIICAFSLLAAMVQTYQHLSYKKNIYENAKDELRGKTREAANSIDAILQQAMLSSQELADGLSAGKVSKQTMLTKLRAMLKSNDNYFGGTITYSPYGYDVKRKLYSAYYSKNAITNHLEYHQLDKIYDYTTPEYDWYVEPMQKGSRWGEPYWDDAAKTYLVTYSAIFYKEASNDVNKTPNGVVTVDISLKHIKTLIESLDIGSSGFGALTTQEGNYLYHPNNEFVLQHKNLRDIARDKNDHDRIELSERAARKENGLINHISTTTGQSSWLMFHAIPTSGWSLQNTFILDDLNIDVDILRGQVIRIIVYILIFITFLCVLSLRVYDSSSVHVWALSCALSLVFLLSIGIIWNLALTYHNADDGNSVKVSEKTILHSYVRTYNQRSLDKNLSKPLYVPTGIYIETIEFSGSSEVSVSGRIWQKYPAAYKENKIGQGIQIGSSRNVKIDFVNTQIIDDKKKLMTWKFQSDIKSKLDYSRYPLEVGKISIYLIPWNKVDNVLLIPDLDAYKLMAATSLPGLDKKVFIQGWDLNKTNFVFKKPSLHTNFGIERNFDRDEFPELHYEIGLKRVFVDAFISNLTPLIIVTIILFSITLLPTDIDISRVLGICVSVFFVLVFSHLAIRRNISIGEIFYLEYFFFVIYFALLLAPINAFRVSLGLKSRFFEYKNGLMVQAIYWPSMTGMFFLISALKFY